MTDLKTLNASGGPEVRHVTIEISDGTNYYRFTDGWSDIDAVIENSETVKFTAIGSEFNEPVKNEDGTQDISFAISNIDGVVSKYITSNIRSQTRMILTRRIYLSSNLTATAIPPEVFEIKGGSWNAFQVTVNAGYFDVLSTLWPREVYNLNKFPGLRYL